MKLHWTSIAKEDLSEAVYHIATNDIEAAVRVQIRIFEAVEDLINFPLKGRQGRKENTRELVVPGLPWLVVYRVRTEEITILRMLHGAQDYS